jgi:cytochrome c553
MRTPIQILAMLLLILLIPNEGKTQSSIAAQPISDTERKALFPSRDLIEFGRTAAEANCAACHGMDGLSSAEGEPNLAGQRTVYLYRVLKALQSGIRRDQSNSHNTFLNDQAILSTAVFYAGLSPAAITKNKQLIEVNAATDANAVADKTALAEVSEAALLAEQAAMAVDDPFLSIRPDMKKCIKCHGASGEAPGSGMPSLTAQDPDYFVTSMMAYVDGSRSHNLMKKLVGNLDETTLKQMGVFYAVQEPLQTETQGEGDVNVGRRLAKDCESCHGVDGNATNPSMPTLAGQDAKYFIKAMRHYKDGTRKHQKMFEAAEPISEQDMIDLATYYAAEVPRRRDVRMPLNSTEWIKRCERCHGIDGNSSDPRFPMLAGQDETYLRNALTAYANGARSNTTMYAMAAALSTMDIQSISTYFASQQPKAVIYMELPCEDDEQ